MSRRILGTIIVLMAACSMPPPPCSINRIMSMDEFMYEAHCFNESLTEIPQLDERERITQLDVSGSNITLLKNHSFSGYNNVQSIYLQNNNIKTIEDNAFRHLDSLTGVYLSENNLTVISSDMFANCSRIITLSFSHNRFIRITENPFLISLTLKWLDLSHCQIRHLPANVFSELPSVKRIDISNNNLTSLNPLTFEHLQHLKAVILDGNPWMCTCELTDTFLLFQKMNISFSPKEIVCFTGREKMNITSVVREKSCRDEVNTVQRDVSAHTEQPPAVGYSQQSTSSQANHISRAEARSNGVETSTPPEEKDITEKHILLAQNVSQLRELVLDIQRNVSAQETRVSHEAEKTIIIIAIIFIAIACLIIATICLCMKVRTIHKNYRFKDLPQNEKYEIQEKLLR